MRRSTARFAHALLVLLLLASLGCAARHLREAQSAFNEAALSENQQRASVHAGGSPLVDSASAAAGYRVSLDLLNKELSENEGKLREERLLGTALVLKAMSLWRISDLEDDSEAAAELGRTLARIRGERNQNAIIVGTRDRVLVAALAGLRDHDTGIRADDLETATGFFDSAYDVLGQALATEKPPPNHPVRVYVRLSQLSTLRAWQAAIWRFEPESSARIQATLPILAKAEELCGFLGPALKTDQQLEAYVNSVNLALGAARC